MIFFVILLIIAVVYLCVLLNKAEQKYAHASRFATGYKKLAEITLLNYIVDSGNDAIYLLLWQLMLIEDPEDRIPAIEALYAAHGIALTDTGLAADNIFNLVKTKLEDYYKSAIEERGQQQEQSKPVSKPKPRRM